MERIAVPFDLADGKTLNVRLTLKHMDQSEANWNLDLWKLTENNFAGLAELARPDRQSMSRVVQIIGDVCEEQITGHGLSAEKFADLMYGDPMKDAVHALTKAAISFFPDAATRELLEAQVDAAHSASDAFFEKAKQKLKSMNFSAELNRRSKSKPKRSGSTAGKSRGGGTSKRRRTTPTESS